MAKKGRKASARKKGVSERIDDWDVEESTVERLLDAMVALIVMCVLLSWSFVTLSVDQHVLTIILIPILIYATLSMPGMRLRLKERMSWLIITDVIAIINAAVLCFYMDTVIVNQSEGWIFKMAFAFVSVFVLLLYVTRLKAMYYITVPAVFVINVVLLWLCGFDMFYVMLFSLLLPMPFAVTIVSHPFYFGIGRLRMKDRYVECPEALARKVRSGRREDKKAARAERRASKKRD